MKQKILIQVEVETSASVEDIQASLRRGIFRGLDTPPLWVAPPSAVEITFSPFPWAVASGPEGIEIGCYCSTQYAADQIASALQEIGYYDAQSVKIQ